jgi:hypothetical protein
MGDLAKTIIEKLKLASKPEDLDGWIWRAGDLLRKSQSADYRSGFEDIDRGTLAQKKNRKSKMLFSKRSRAALTQDSFRKFSTPSGVHRTNRLSRFTSITYYVSQAD